MTIDELKDCFWDKFNNCYPVIHEEYNNILMYYDINYIRAKKLANILNKDVEYPTEVKGVCLFCMDYRNRLLYMDSDEILTFFELNYSSIHHDIFGLIRNWLDESDEFKKIIPIECKSLSKSMLEKYNNLKVLSPRFKHNVECFNITINKK